MSLTILNTSTMQSLLIDMWQQQLNTTENPANGQWYTNGPNNDGIGLYGGLTDSTAVIFNESARTSSQSNTVIDAVTVTGPMVQMVSLTGLPADTLAITHTLSNAFYNPLPVITGVAHLTGSGAMGGVQFVFPYGHVWQTAQSTHIVKPAIASVPAQVIVPPGSIYQAVLTANIGTLTIPYTAGVMVTGNTETWFANPVNGHYNHTDSAAVAFAQIGQWNLAGAGSSSYIQINGGGAVAETGTMVYKQVLAAQIMIIDITHSAPYVVGGIVTPPAGATLVHTMTVI